MTLADAQEKLEAWRSYYNEVRPHGAIGNRSPISLQNPDDAPSPSSLKQARNSTLGRSKDWVQSKEARNSTFGRSKDGAQSSNRKLPIFGGPNSGGGSDGKRDYWTNYFTGTINSVRHALKRHNRFLSSQHRGLKRCGGGVARRKLKNAHESGRGFLSEKFLKVVTRSRAGVCADKGVDDDDSSIQPSKALSQPSPLCLTRIK